MFDYKDPGTDPTYCDRYGTPEPELCPDCKGDGVTWQHVEGGYLEKVTCGECEGRGYYEETTA